MCKLAQISRVHGFFLPLRRRSLCCDKMASQAAAAELDYFAHSSPDVSSAILYHSSSRRFFRFTLDNTQKKVSVVAQIGSHDVI